MEKNNFERIIEVIDTLTGPDGCPWDKEQTPQSMCDYLVEECFELVEAIRQDDKSEIAEELGDVLFLLLFIGRCHDRVIPDFLQTALAGNVAKMIRRHPHVYGEKAADVAEVIKNWEQIKKQEKAEKDKDPGVFVSLPASLPPLLRAYRINSKAARTGFTWATDALKRSLYFVMSLEVVQKLFVTHDRLRQTMFKRRQVLLVFGQSRSDGVVDEIGERTVGMYGFKAQGCVQLRVEIDGGSFCCFGHDAYLCKSSCRHVVMASRIEPAVPTLRLFTHLMKQPMFPAPGTENAAKWRRLLASMFAKKGRYRGLGRVKGVPERGLKFSESGLLHIS